LREDPSLSGTIISEIKRMRRISDRPPHHWHIFARLYRKSEIFMLIKEIQARRFTEFQTTPIGKPLFVSFLWFVDPPPSFVNLGKVFVDSKKTGNYPLMTWLSRKVQPTQRAHKIQCPSLISQSSGPHCESRSVDTVTPKMTSFDRLIFKNVTGDAIV
jgi:hypothetical protein